MDADLITVFTPAYNRAYSLPRLFESLQRQTFRGFEWIVVDDGSTDGTRALCESFTEKATFPMRYYRQQNAGKHVAINLAANVARGGWLFIVDSDDWLPDKGLEVSMNHIRQIAGDSRFAGVVGLRGTDETHMLWFPGMSFDKLSSRAQTAMKREYIDATSNEYRYTLGIPGDRAEIVRTSLVQSHPFPVFQGERFMSEGWLWQALADEGYLFRWINSITYCGNYLEDGLTANGRRRRAESPRGTACINNFLIASPGIPASHKPRMAVNYIRYGRLAGGSIRSLFYRCRNKPLFIPALPVALTHPVKPPQSGKENRR